MRLRPGGSRVAVLDADGRLLFSFDASGPGNWTISWSADGSRLALLSSGFPRDVLRVVDAATLALRYFGRGRTSQHGLALLDIAPGSRPRRVFAGRRDLSRPGWLPDGSALAFTVWPS